MLLFDPLRRYRRLAAERCLEVAQAIVHEIQVQRVTPVLTGELRDSYKAVRDGGGAKVTTSADYWLHVEFGTTEMAAEPHIRPAVERLRRRVRRLNRQAAQQAAGR